MDTGIGSSLYMFSGTTSPTNGSLLQDSNMSIHIESSSSGSSLNHFMQTVKENISKNSNSTASLMPNIQQQKHHQQAYQSDLDHLDVESSSTLVTEHTPATVRDNNSSSTLKKYASSSNNNSSSGSNNNNDDCLSDADSSTFADSEINSIRTEEFVDMFNSQYRNVPFLKLNSKSESNFVPLVY